MSLLLHLISKKLIFIAQVPLNKSTCLVIRILNTLYKQISNGNITNNTRIKIGSGVRNLGVDNGVGS